MSSLEAAALWAGLNAILLIVLSGWVGRNRVKHRVNLGHGDKPEMIRAIRAQGNYVEYAPAAIGGLVLLALLDAPVMAIHGLGGVFFFARLAHFMGLGLGVWPMGRAVGTVLTMLTLLVTGLWLIARAVF